VKIIKVVAILVSCLTVMEAGPYEVMAQQAQAVAATSLGDMGAPMQSGARPAAGLPAEPQPNFTQPLFLRSTSKHFDLPVSYFPRFWEPYIAQTIDGGQISSPSGLSDLLKDGKIRLSLADAVMLAIENNPDIAIARYNLDIADTDMLRARAGSSLRGVSTGVVANTLGGTTATISGGGGPGGTSSGAGGSGAGTSGLVLSTNGSGPAPEALDPTLTGIMQLERSITPESTQLLNGTNVVNQHTNQYNFGYMQGFLSGTALSFSFSNERVASNSERALYSPLLQSYFQARVQQHLLQGFHSAVNGRFIVQAKNDRQITDASFRQQLLYTINQVENIYWALVSAWEDEQSKERALEQSKQLASDNRKQLEVGTLARLDVMNADSQVASDQQALMSSRNNLEYQQLLMKQAIVSDLEDHALANAEVIPTDRVSLTPTAEEEMPVEDLIRQAQADSPEAEEGALTVRNDEITLKAMRNGLLPVVDFYGYYSANALGGAQNPNLTCGSTSGPFVPCSSGTVPQSGYGSTFGKLWNGSGPDSAVGLSVTIPLRNRTAQADQMRSQLEYRQARLRLKQIYTQIRIQVMNERYALSNDRAQVQAATAARDYAAESLDAERQRFQLGDSATSDVLQAQRNLAIAEDNLISAKAAYARDRAALYLSSATTLEHFGIGLVGAATGIVSQAYSTPALEKPNLKQQRVPQISTKH
jgi:outer membrane protein